MFQRGKRGDGGTTVPLASLSRLRARAERAKRVPSERLRARRVRGEDAIESHLPPHPTPLPNGEREQAEYAATLCLSRHRKHDQLFGPRRRRCGGSVVAVGVGVSSALLTATLVPSEMRAKPVVTTFSSALSPSTITACTSSCCDTVTGRTPTESSLTT